MTQSKTSLGQMLELLRDLDDDMLPEEFDPAQLIGDVREKVDAIKWKMNDWEYKAKMIEEEYLKPLLSKVRALLGKRDRLKEYVTHEMLKLGVEKIPGNMFRVQLQDSPKSVKVRIPADASMYLNYPEIVKQDTSYKWDRDAIKACIEAGTTFTFAEIKQSKHIRFYAQGTAK